MYNITVSNVNTTIVKMMRGKKAENEKKNEPRYFTKSVANPYKNKFKYIWEILSESQNIE